MKEAIIKQLLEATDYLSGEELSRVNGVSRTAIWKQIKKLKEEGYEILSVNNRGYKIARLPEGYIREELKMLLKKRSIIKDVRVYNTIDSTNQEAKRLGSGPSIDGLLLISEEQTMGKGRRGRTWLSKKGDGIFMSLLLRPQIQPVHASMLTILAGLAVQKAIVGATGLACKIKWPNDVVVSGKKVCGILTEMSTDMEEIQFVVVGIGVNVNALEMDPEAAPYATSLCMESGKTYERKLLAAAIVEQFELYYMQFIQDCSLEPILSEYNRVCANIGGKVRIESGGSSFVADALRMDESGALVVKLEDGQIKQIHSGEVSVRGLYGYVD